MTRHTAVRIHNLTRRVALARRGRRARSALSRLRGLIGRRGLGADEALVLEPCSGIHTCFMRFSIDVLFLDPRGRVLRSVAALPPWRATPVLLRARTVVELPAGTLAATGTRVGDEVVVSALTPVRRAGGA